MKRLVIVACIILSSITACKKETVREVSTSDYFMTNTTGSRTKLYLELFPTYNVNPQNIIIDKDSIVIKKAGLYHFEGTHHFWLSRQNVSFPVYYDLSLEIHPSFDFYTLGSGTTQKQNDMRDVAGFSFALDIYMNDNTAIRLPQTYDNALAGGSIYGTFGGYRKGN